MLCAAQQSSLSTDPSFLTPIPPPLASDLSLTLSALASSYKMTQSDFWDQYHSSFSQNHTQPVKTEFGRLASKMGWRKGSFEHRERWRACCVSEIAYQLDFEGDKLEDMQELCETLRVTPVPTSVTKCRQALKRIHVNVLDLVDALREGHAVPTFPNYLQLRDYTVKKKRYVPVEAAKEDGIVKVLLKTF